MGKAYPIGAFRFKVEINDLEVSGGFTDVTGLEAEVDLEEYREGGMDRYMHYFPKGVKYPRLVLKRGIVDSSLLRGWYNDVIAGKISRQKISVILCNSTGTDVTRWDFLDAYPVKWAGPELKADSSVVAVETLEFVHRGMK